jgi:hypothetical protein
LFVKTSLFQGVNLVSLDAIRQYIALLWRRYQRLKIRQEKSEIIDEICRNLEVHRKSALRLMNARDAPKLVRSKGTRSRRYSDTAREQVRFLWRKMGYIGAVRMKAALPDWLPHYQGTDDDVKLELLRMSPSTIERLLKEDKAQLRRKMNTGTKRGKLIVTQVPLRDFDFAPKEPGHIEADTVAHCGGSLTGSFVRTVTTTDIVTGWTECEAVEALTGVAVKEAFETIERRLPFSLKGLYFDNGSEFINKDVITNFAKGDGRDIPAKRGRPYRKNDQARVEQKNYTHVRQAFGYDRINGRVAVNHMNTIYRKEWRLLQNFFMPQTKVISKQRFGSKLVRKLDKPKTPYQRLLDHPEVPTDVKTQLLRARETLDPFELRRGLAIKLRKFARYMTDQWVKGFRGKYHDDPSKI